MKIDREKTEYYEFTFEFPFSQEILAYCRFLREAYGWKDFSFSEGKWRFNDTSIIFLIQTKFESVNISDAVLSILKKTDEEKKSELEIEENAKRLKNSVDSDLVIENIKGELRGYQKVGVSFFLNNGGRGILSDEMGSGKTLQALAYVVKAGHNKTLIVSPASVKFSWENEVEKWTSLKSFVINSKTIFKDIPVDTEVFIINYDILKKHLKSIISTKWDCCILDESHLIKTPSSTRSKAARIITSNIKSVLLLTGSPILNRPIELFHLLHIIDKKTWSNYYDFGRKYCDGKMGRFGFEAKGAKNLEELKSRIDKYFLRRTKDQILPELPPKNRINVPMQLSGKDKDNYDKVLNDLVKYLKENKGKKEKEILKSLNAEKLVKINYLRSITAMGKLDTVRELIDSIVETGEKVLVFCSFNEPLKILRDEYPNSVIILGETSVEERGSLVKKFQNDPTSKVFFGGFRSAGVGITLTAASNCIMIDHSWSPSDMAQSEDRMHRISQTADSVNI